jgi:hypothetical protein
MQGTVSSKLTDCWLHRVDRLMTISVLNFGLSVICVHTASIPRTQVTVKSSTCSEKVNTCGRESTRHRYSVKFSDAILSVSIGRAWTGMSTLLYMRWIFLSQALWKLRYKFKLHSTSHQGFCFVQFIATPWWEGNVGFVEIWTSGPPSISWMSDSYSNK